ncbi:MAG: leucine--tRNA ligase [Cyclobacteriaceae bacterium]|nr:MAG: leucine--tRNA ligase [Cyclobacteriaceae bacterium]
MTEYNFQEIEKKWQQYWNERQVFKTLEDPDKPKYYVLDMFPYPSGAGLHVGHPLGYIATDIVARYKRACGYNVLHPMGFDSFGLPAEQYAIKTGQHPAETTETNINRFKKQLEVLGFSYDWQREVRTSDPDYYRWTQWIFLKLFNSYFDHQQQKALDISKLPIPSGLTEEEKQEFINEQRLAYQAEISVNWCPDLGTVLANEEVVGGVSERGGYPVVRKPLRQWMLRITAYADRLLDGLEELDWPESIKTSQKNWIGRSYGAEIQFPIKDFGEGITVYTTRPDTIYGVTYMVLAPEHLLVPLITTDQQKATVDQYLEQTSKKSDLERSDLDKTKTGVFTGAFAINPINQQHIPIWISDYVLISYGTGAVMAVPGGDQRDFEFAKKFDLPIILVVAENGSQEELQEVYAGHGTMINSAEYNGLHSKEFTKVIIDRLEQEGVGKAAVNYKLRDWIFTRQRYWGEPIPLIHTEKDGVVAVPEDQLPVVLPEVEDYKPTQDGQSPLAKAEEWVNTISPVDGSPAKRETNTMPQWAGSCWYYLRFMDPENKQNLADYEKLKQWSPVDLYVGGAEHAVLHLLYARFWHKVLHDLEIVPTDEPFQKLVNQGMIQGRSNFAYRIQDTNTFVSFNLRKEYKTTPIHVDIDLCRNDVLDIEAFRKWQPDLTDAEFVLENGKYICGSEVEKMSKSKLNVVSPDQIVTRYGADTLRMYEMFLGPLEQGKPWSTHGIDGVFKFLRKFWNLFHNDEGNLIVTDEKPTAEELKITHQTIKKIGEDIERLSLNTCVSTLMICTNTLTNLNCSKKTILRDLVIVIAPFAPHLAEELWQLLGEEPSVSLASFPQYNEQYLKEDSYEYPVSVNGKMRARMKFGVDMPKQDIEQAVLESEVIQKWIGGKTPKKVIVVPGKIVNVVV